MTLAASCDNRVFLFESRFPDAVRLASATDEVEFRLTADYIVNDVGDAAPVMDGEADGSKTDNIVMMGWISEVVNGKNMDVWFFYPSHQ